MIVLKLMSNGFIIVSLFLQNVNGNHYFASEKKQENGILRSSFLSHEKGM